MHVMILGAGPAGLLAAHAAVITGHDVSVYSKKRKSFMRGAQYLHAPIPMLDTGHPFIVSYDMEGSIEGYKQKVYGDQRVKVSPESLLGGHLAWDIRLAYDQLWEMYGAGVNDTTLDADSYEDLVESVRPDLVVNSVPRRMFCWNTEHGFTEQKVWVTEQYRGEDTDINRVLCSGDLSKPWYRTSVIQDWENTEYPEFSKPPLSADKLHEVIKPIKSNCNCSYRTAYKAGAKHMLVGRYGAWTKGVLSHHAFYDVFQALDTSKVKDTNQ